MNDLIRMLDDAASQCCNIESIKQNLYYLAAREIEKLRSDKIINSPRMTIAIAAMQGDWARGSFTQVNPSTINAELEVMAGLYFRMADAMIKVSKE